MFKKAIFIGWLLILLFIVGLISGSSELIPADTKGPKVCPAGPRIQFKEKEFNFGAAGEGERITHIFTFTNIGGKNLEIKEVATSCGCTAAVTSAEIIPPGGGGQIQVIFDLSRRKGLQEKEIYVSSNDPERSMLVLRISGEVKTDIGLEPESLNFVNIHGGKRVEKQIKIVQVEKDELKINKIEANPKYFSVTLSSLQEDTGKKGFNMRVSLLPDAPAGIINEVITLHSTSKRRPRVDIPIFGNILGKIKVKPKILSFGTVEKGTSAERKIVLLREDDQEFKIVKIDKSTELLSTRISKNEHMNGYILLVMVSDEYPAGRIDEAVHIYTDIKEQAMIEIPIYGLVKLASRATIKLGNCDPPPVKWKRTKVPIIINSGSEVIGAYSLSLKYNPKVFYIDDLDLNQDGIPDVIHPTCPQFGLPMNVKLNPQQGIIRLNDYQLNENAPKGVVTIMSLSLKVIGDIDKRKDLRLHDYLVTNKNSETILSFGR